MNKCLPRFSAVNENGPFAVPLSVFLTTIGFSFPKVLKYRYINYTKQMAQNVHLFPCPVTRRFYLRYNSS